MSGLPTSLGPRQAEPLDSNQRLKLIAQLLSASPTTSGVFGREALAALALASGEEVDAVRKRLAEAEQAGSPVANACAERLPILAQGSDLPSDPAGCSAPDLRRSETRSR